MDLLSIIRVAFRALQRNKMRAALTMLGIIIGVSAVVAMQEDPIIFRAGVAFVGKRPPASYEENPATLYDPLPIKLGQSVMRM